MKDNYKHFIFDLYGTLVDIHTDETLPSLWANAANYFTGKGMPCSPSALQSRYIQGCETALREKNAYLFAEGISGPAEIDLTKVWGQIASEAGGKLSQADVLEFSRLFREWSTCKLRLFPEARQVLEELRRRQKTVILLTNAQASFTLPELEKLGIVQLFDIILISSDYGIKKPSPAFFARLFDAGKMHPNESLMIGNDDICDCHGAAAAGMDSLYIFTEQSPSRSQPLPDNCIEIGSLTEVLSFT